MLELKFNDQIKETLRLCVSASLRLCVRFILIRLFFSTAPRWSAEVFER